MRNFQDIFETRKRSFFSAFSIYMTVPLSKNILQKKITGVKQCFEKKQFKP